MAGGLTDGFELCNAVDVGTVTSSSIGTAVTNASTSYTKGSWTQLIASTSYSASWVDVSLGSDTSSFQSVNWTDIGIGGSGSEQVLIPNLLWTNYGNGPGNIIRYSFPLSIPSGTRIAARTAGDNGDTAHPIWCGLTLFSSSLDTSLTGGAVDAYGITTASSPATTTVTPSTTDNTKGSWKQIGSSGLSYNIIGFVLYFDPGTETTYSSATWQFLIDIGLGPSSGSVSTLIPNLEVTATAVTGTSFMFPTPSCIGFLPIKIASGTNIWARCQVKDRYASGETPRQIGIAFYGVRG